MLLVSHRDELSEARASAYQHVAREPSEYCTVNRLERETWGEFHDIASAFCAKMGVNSALSHPNVALGVLPNGP